MRRAPVSCIATEYCALDLHVLSTPPAFALSQDQTLVCILCLEMQNPESLRCQTSSGELFVVARFPQIAWLTLRQSKCEPNGFWHISFDQLSKSGPPVQQAGIQATDRFYQARRLSQGIKVNAKWPAKTCTANRSLHSRTIRDAPPRCTCRGGACLRPGFPGNANLPISAFAFTLVWSSRARPPWRPTRDLSVALVLSTLPSPLTLSSRTRSPGSGERW